MSTGIRARLFFCAGAVLLLACETAGEVERGELGQPCYRNATCEAGLVCQGGACVPGDATWAGAPLVTVLRGPPALTRETTAILELRCDAPDCGLVCALDGEVMEDCQSPVTYEGLADRAYVFVAQGVDGEGRLGPPTAHRWTVDTRPPEVTVLSGPPRYVAAPNVALEVSCDEATCTFECVLGEDDPVACPPRVEYADLPDGDYLFGARAIDAAGNVGEAAYHPFTVDTVPPVSTLTATPGEWSRYAEATFDFEADEEAVFSCQLDGQGWMACDPPVTYEGLPAGERLFEVRAVDRAGNVEVAPSRHGWTVDLDPPRTRIVSGPPTPSVAETAEIVFEADEPATFECRLDDDPWAPCESPFIVEDLTSGWRVVYVRATDRAGNTEMKPAAHGWMVARPWRHFTAGAAAAFGIRVDGTLWGWGNLRGLGAGGSATGRRIPDRMLTNQPWRAATVGPWGHACAITVAGTLWCWGPNSDGQVSGAPSSGDLPPTPFPLVGPWREASAGQRYTCAIHEEGTLWCWGRLPGGTQSPPTQVGEDDDWERVDGGDQHVCGIRAGGTLWCWGSGGSGRLGTGGTSSQDVPVQIGEDDTWREVATGPTHTCAITVEGELHCWGSNADGRLGVGLTELSQSLVPMRVGDASDWAEVRLGTGQACGLRADGDLYCWGRNNRGQVGDGSQENRYSPVAVGEAGGWVEVATGDLFTCARREDDGAQCWGWGQSGRLGSLDPPDERLEPGEIDLTTRHGFVDRSRGGDGSACAIRPDGSLFCWGAGGTRDRVLPSPVRQVSAIHNHVCALTWDGAIWCWGAEPTRVGADRAWIGVAAGGDETCAVDAGRRLWCWEGDLEAEPTRIGEDEDWSETLVVAGRSRCALKVDGSRWCWGRNDVGQLGDGTTNDRALPMRIDDGGGWTDLTGYDWHMCGMRGDRAFCWGENWYGNVGAGFSSLAVTTPTEVGDGGWVQVSAGWRTCGIRTDRSLWCWGYGDPEWDLGDGSGLSSNRPVRVLGRDFWQATDTHCALRLDGVIRCWAGWGEPTRGPEDPFTR